jgi:hypothetical protein
MPFIRALVELNNDSLQPVDRSTNTWHFELPDATAPTLALLTTQLDDFYTSVGGLFGPQLTGTGNIKYYNLEDAEPRAPIGTGLVTFTPGANGFPSEVAICLSYQGTLVSGESQARRRGRLYLGPLSITTGSIDSGDVRVTAAARTTIATAADALMDSTTIAGRRWCVFSPATAGPPPWSAGTLLDAFVTITNGWVNNDFDTQRSRGLRSSARTIFP